MTAHDRAGIAGPVQERADGLDSADPAARGDELALFTQAQGPDGKLLMPERSALLGSRRCSPHW